MFANGLTLHSGKRVLEPVPGLRDASTEEDDEYIMPVNMGSVPESEETEWTRSTKESMLDDVPIMDESDDDRPLITLTGLSTKARRRGRGTRPLRDDNFHRYA